VPAGRYRPKDGENLREDSFRAAILSRAETKLFHVHTLDGFFNLSTWLTAIAGVAVLLLAYRLITG
jgi:hypothetical protein